MVLMLLNEQDKNCLLKIAKASIQQGITSQQPLKLKLQDLPATIIPKRATFVTLHKLGQLRGCIGVLEAFRALAEDIAQNAYSAAFNDPRFPPLVIKELQDLDIHLSILNAPEPLFFNSEQELLNKMQPGIDGLILADLGHRGTFLPSVWESFSEPEQFLQQLKLKAGLSPDYWSNSLTVSRYTTQSITSNINDQ